MTKRRLSRIAVAVAFGGTLLLAEPLFYLVLGIPRGDSLDRQQLLIYTAVLERLGKSPRYPVDRWEGYCISVLEQDPAPELMERLEALPVPAKSLSACGITRDDIGQLKLPAGHLLLRITSSPEWSSGVTATVEAGDHLGSLAATGYRFTVVRAWGRWWPVRQTMLWIA